MKRTLIVNYPCLGPGGIESHIAGLMRHFISKGDRVIWITSRTGIDNSIYPEVSNCEDVEKILITPKNIFFLPHISLSDDEIVVMLSFRALSYAFYEGIKKSHKNCTIFHYFVLAHFEGKEYYPDYNLQSKVIKEALFRQWRKVVKRLIQNNTILAYDIKHFEAYEDYYKVKIEQKEKRIMPVTFDYIDYDEINVIQRFDEKKDIFIVSTCARIDFPHKGYLLGLVDSFEKVKKLCPWIKLLIIGDGKDRNRLEEKVNSKSEYVKKDIEIVGTLSRNELFDRLKKTHLVVGLAGGAVSGAICGIPTLLARHNSYDCYTYGFIENNIENILGEYGGYPIEEYIIDVIKMQKDEYCRHAQKGYNAVKEKYQINPDILFEYKSSSKSILGRRECLLWKIVYSFSVLR